MIIDLTNTFIQIAHTNVDLNKIYSLIENIKILLPILTVDWEEGDEDWVRVLKDNSSSCAFIRVDKYLCFVRPGEREIISLVEDAGYTVIQCEDWDSNIFSVSPEVIEIHYSNWIWRITDEGSEGFHLDAFSVYDLWWATI